MSWRQPFEILDGERNGPLIIVCDHASNAVPEAVGDLGVSAADMQRHIAWDIGAAPIARFLAHAFSSTAVLCGTSRLVIDCNRHLSDPTLIPEVSDGTVIPGNRNLSRNARQLRIDDYFTPYHDACHEVVTRKLAQGKRPLFVSVHSMTEKLAGIDRPWQISLSSNDNRRATDPVLKALKSMRGIVMGDNQPYNMVAEEDYTTPIHALNRGLDYVQVEFRQDCVATPEGQKRFAGVFAQALKAALEELSIRI
jgi:predicted N-formylglutamate amidohydrolase